MLGFTTEIDQSELWTHPCHVRIISLLLKFVLFLTFVLGSEMHIPLKGDICISVVYIADIDSGVLHLNISEHDLSYVLPTYD